VLKSAATSHCPCRRSRPATTRADGGGYSRSAAAADVPMRTLPPATEAENDSSVPAGMVASGVTRTLIVPLEAERELQISASPSSCACGIAMRVCTDGGRTSRAVEPTGRLR